MERIVELGISMMSQTQVLYTRYWSGFSRGTSVYEDMLTTHYRVFARALLGILPNGQRHPRNLCRRAL